MTIVPVVAVATLSLAALSTASAAGSPPDGAAFATAGSFQQGPGVR
ncbi:MAG TPA: hypothetical protein QGI71_07645 [Dehalococcoidia bacterium]|nr:hypothetical protein [Dehalococcoidia bacterium]